MSKPTLETSKKLINLLYSSTASKLPLTNKGSIISDITTPTISRILYQDLSSTSGNTDNILDLASPPSPRLKFPTEHKSLRDIGIVNSNIIRFKCPILYITKNDLVKSLLTLSLGNFKYDNDNDINGLRKLPSYYNNNNQFELIKKRDYRINTNQPLKFLGEYYMIFENQLLANKFIQGSPNNGVIINGMRIHFEIIKLNESILKSMSNEKISDFNKINEILSIINKPENDNGGDGDGDSNDFQILKNWLGGGNQNRDNYVLVQNWPFGLSSIYISKLLWNYKLLDIINIKTDIKQQLNIVLLKFDNHKDSSRFIRNFHGRKWDHLQLKSNTINKEIIFYQPLLCETL